MPTLFLCSLRFYVPPYTPYFCLLFSLGLFLCEMKPTYVRTCVDFFYNGRSRFFLLSLFFSFCFFSVLVTFIALLSYPLLSLVSFFSLFSFNIYSSLSLSQFALFLFTINCSVFTCYRSLFFFILSLSSPLRSHLLLCPFLSYSLVPPGLSLGWLQS